MDGAYNKRHSTVGTIPKFKIILLGEVGVGKSALFLRFKDDVFGEHLQPTLGIESCSKTVNVDDEKVIFQVWDTAGVEKYRTLTRNYYRNTHATFLIYSLDNPASLHYLAKWAQDSLDAAPNVMKKQRMRKALIIYFPITDKRNTAPMFLIGNKCDLEWNITQTSIEDFACANDFESAHVMSAKTGEGIESSLSTIGQKLLDSYKVPSLQGSFLDSTIIHKHTRRDENITGECGC